ncbi:TPA: hypothetical protein QCX13_000125 [Bacillus toyonensis]|nr:hypothetical protein [Bacillus toyonensis]
MEATRSYHEQNKKLIGIQKAWYEQFQSIVEMCNDIDWNLVGEETAERIIDIDGILRECEEDQWCLDFEIIDAIEGREITQELISEYVSNNLDSYIEQITNDPIYELHATLIKETYEAFKGGYYKLCAMPLFAAFEHVLATWADGNIKTDFVSVWEKPITYSVKAAIKSEQYSKIEEEQFTKVFVLSIIRMLEKTFVQVPKKLCKVLNRNSIAHGFHDYDSINEINILKLFQLLKSTLIIRHFDSGMVKK